MKPSARLVFSLLGFMVLGFFAEAKSQPAISAGQELRNEKWLFELLRYSYN
jgi:hypothetical protein